MFRFDSRHLVESMSSTKQTRTMEHAAADHTRQDNRILPDPKPIVIVSDLGSSSINLQLRFWIEDPLLKWEFMWEYTEKCKIALDKAGIEIPYPHMQLFLENTKGLQLLASKLPLFLLLRESTGRSCRSWVIQHLHGDAGRSPGGRIS